MYTIYRSWKIAPIAWDPYLVGQGVGKSEMISTAKLLSTIQPEHIFAVSITNHHGWVWKQEQEGATI